MVLVGGGPHAKVIVDILESSGALAILGFTDRERPEDKEVLCGYPYLGSDDVLAELFAAGVRHAFVAIGDNGRRKLCLDAVKACGFELVNAISPHAVVSKRARLGRSVAVMPGAIVNTGSRIEDGAIINTNAGVDHDCVIGECAHVGPGSAIAGSVRIGARVFLGTGCRVIPGITIGSDTIVGAGAVVVRDLPERVVAYGVPAAVKRANTK